MKVSTRTVLACAIAVACTPVLAHHSAAAFDTQTETTITGTITEYKGNNYILVTRAILKSKPSALGKPTGKPQK